MSEYPRPPEPISLWARRSDEAPWQSSMTIIAAIVLVVILIADRFLISSPVLLFWGVLWVGVVSATLSLWAALYHPSAAPVTHQPPP